MPPTGIGLLEFAKRSSVARFIGPDGQPRQQAIEVRTDPVTGRTARITFARAEEKEPGGDRLPDAPPDANDVRSCPFCRPQVKHMTPRFLPEFAPDGRLVHGESVLFPNLFPYGGYSAVSLFDNHHYVEIGSGREAAYADSFINCGKYLRRVLETDADAVFMAVTQNHLPSAGGSLLHPHLQVHADRIPANYFRFLNERAKTYYRDHGRRLFSDYLREEMHRGERMIGTTGDWHWLAAFAPEGFFEVWAILPGAVTIVGQPVEIWSDLAAGVMKAQRFFRSRRRNGYNLGLLAVARPDSALELRLRMVVRSNHGAWVRNDHTGYEVMLGDMATFHEPEKTAVWARPFWEPGTP